MVDHVSSSARGRICNAVVPRPKRPTVEANGHGGQDGAGRPDGRLGIRTCGFGPEDQTEQAVHSRGEDEPATVTSKVITSVASRHRLPPHGAQTMGARALRIP